MPCKLNKKKSYSVAAYSTKIDKLSSDEIKTFQEEKLREQLQYLSDSSPYYQRLFLENKIDISKIKQLEDLKNIPFTTKDNLQNFNADFLCTPRTEIIDWVTTSGTLGKPIFFGSTENDLKRLAYNELLTFKLAEISKEDTIQLMLTLNKRFMAGIAYFEGLRRLGASIIRVGNGSPGLQLDSIKMFHPIGVVVVPSFLIKLAEFIEHQGLNPKALGIKKAICIGEPIRDQKFNLNILGQKIIEKWGNIQLFSTYASTEMSTAFSECPAGKGGHLQPELIIIEILDEDGNWVREGELGEVVATTLGIDAMPLLRFKTGDLCSYESSPCSCGRNTLRLTPIIGRKQQMLKVKGTSIYPPAIFEVLNETKEIEEYVVEFYSNDLGLDAVLVKYFGAEDSIFINKLKDKFRAKLRLIPEIQSCSFEEIMKMKFPAMNRKPVKLIDKRQL